MNAREQKNYLIVVEEGGDSYALGYSPDMERDKVIRVMSDAKWRLMSNYAEDGYHVAFHGDSRSPNPGWLCPYHDGLASKSRIQWISESHVKFYRLNDPAARAAAGLKVVHLYLYDPNNLAHEVLLAEISHKVLLRGNEPGEN